MVHLRYSHQIIVLIGKLKLLIADPNYPADKNRFNDPHGKQLGITKATNGNPNGM